VGDWLAQALALPESTRSALSGTFPTESEQATTFGVLSLLIVLLSATSFSRAMTRMYAKLWSVRGPGWHSPWRWIAAIVAIASCTVALRAIQRAAGDDVGWLTAAMVLTVAANTVLWTWIPSVLLAAEVPWRRLAPGGLLTGLATVAIYFASRIYIPSALVYADSHFGELGVAFTAIGWLFCLAFVLIATSVVGAVLVEGPGPVARFVTRQSQRSAGARGAGSRTSHPSRVTYVTVEGSTVRSPSQSPHRPTRT